jgi:hypothetical protein
MRNNHFTQLEWLLSKRQMIKSTNGERDTYTQLLEAYISISITETILKSLKIKNRIIIWSRNPTTVYVTKGNGISVSRRHLYSHVYFSTTHNSQEMTPTNLSIHQLLINLKKWYIHTIGYLSIIKKNSCNNLQWYRWNWRSLC